ncbi:MAG TPA: hypothetical protein VK688_09130 [Gemmatimonadales bacterium]|nr:hypothetical protein [Gemmatimonadales bacterium]
MIKTAALVATAALLAACGHAIATASVSESQLAPPDAFQCVMREFEVLGFQRTSYDKGSLLTNARRVNPKITFSNVQFRRTWDRLEVQVQAGSKGTDLKVTPSTAAEYFGQTGPVLNPLETSAEAKEAAAALQQACSSSATAPPPAPQQ